MDEELKNLWIEFSGNNRFNGLRWLTTELIAKYEFISRSKFSGERCLKGIRERSDDEIAKKYSDVVPF